MKTKRVIRWKHAEEQFILRMEAFRDEVFDLFLVPRVERDQFDWNDSRGFDDAETRVKYRDACIEAFVRVWRRKVRRGLQLIEKAALSQKSGKKYGPVRTRNKEVGKKPKPKPRAVKKKPGRSQSKKRNHGKTGRPKGRPIGWVYRPGERAARRKAHERARKEAFAKHLAVNRARKILGWKSYPWKRWEKVPGWLDEFKRGGPSHGTRGGYPHAAKAPVAV